MLWLTRFSVASLVIGAYALLANAQTQEVLREFAVSDGASSTCCSTPSSRRRRCSGAGTAGRGRAR
ncbi:MAG: hypothetical protein IPI27_08275 [Betaproteobacteria bacterium]|nr:hypothetical protein [Betaproteobacteria bacterium]